jgi:hypothetical protein
MKANPLRPAVYTGLALSAALTVGSVAAINNLEHSDVELRVLGGCSATALIASGAIAAYAARKKKS